MISMDTIGLGMRYLMPIVLGGVGMTVVLMGLLRLGNRGEVGGEGDGAAGGDGGAGAGAGAGGGAGGGAAVITADSPLDIFPEDLRADANVSKYKTVGDLIKGHIETVKMVGKKGVLIPASNASPEEVAKFYNTLGRPEKPELYKMPQMKGLHKSLEGITPESGAAFAKTAHDLGLTQAQFEGLNKWYFSTVSDGLTKKDANDVKAMQEAETKLRNEWGNEFDQNLSIAQRVAVKFGGKDAIDALGDLGNNPAALRLLANVGRKLSEDSIARGEVSSLTGSPEDAAAKIKQVLADPKHPYFDENHPQHGEWVGNTGEMAKLYRMAHAEKDGA